MAENALIRFARALGLLGPAPGTVIARTLPVWSAQRPQPPRVDYTALVKEGYKGNAVIFGCIREISTSAADMRLALDTGDSTDEIMEHEVLALLNRPNPEQGFVEFFTEYLVHLETTGNAFVHKVRNAAGQVVQLWMLRPDRLRIKRSVVDGSIEFYQFVLMPGQTLGVPIQPGDVIHHKWMPDPEDDNYGLSPVVVCARIADLDGNCIDYLRSFFLNGGVPAGLLSLEGKVPDDERDRIKRRWKEQTTRLRVDQTSGQTIGWNDVSVIDARVKFEQIAADIERLKLQPIFDQTEARMCAVYNIPPIIVGVTLGINRSTYANYAEARKALWWENLLPLHREIASLLTRGLVSEWDPTGKLKLRLRIDTANIAVLQEDEDKKSARVTGQWTAGLITLNEARESIGREPFEDWRGDFTIIEGSVPTDPALEPAAPPAPTPPEAGNAPTVDHEGNLVDAQGNYVDQNGDPTDVPIAAPPGLVPPKPKPRAVPAAARRTARQAMPGAWLEFARAEGEQERALARVMRRTLATMQRDFLAKLAVTPAGAEHTAVPTPESLEPTFRDALAGELPDLLEAGWKQGVRRLSGQHRRSRRLVVAAVTANGTRHQEHAITGVGDFDIEQPGIAGYLTDRPRLYSPQVAKTTVTAFRKALDEGIAEQEGIPELADRVAAKLGPGTEARALTIARTEAIAAMNQSSHEAYKAAGAAEKEWLSAHDERVRETHAEADGQRVGIDDAFSVGGAPLDYPGDPSGPPEEIINCRCTLLPVVD